MLLEGNLQSVQHVGIFVPDLEFGKRWYVDKLGSRVEYEPVIETEEGDIGLAFLDLNGMVIELVQLAGPALEEVKGRGEGHIDHLAIDVLDIDQALAERTAAGARLDEKTPDGPQDFPLFEQGVKYAFLEGPFGERVELNEALHLDRARRPNNLGGWSHLGITVTDLERSKAFYRQFGFEEIAAAEVPAIGGTVKVALVEKGGFVLELVQLAEPELAGVRARGDGLIDHVALDVLDADRAYAELTAAGLRPLEPAPVALPLFDQGVKYFNVRGPDGEKVEFNEVIRA